MKTKTIPFDLETAKKIQAGEIEGKIKTGNRNDVRIICFDRIDEETPILFLVRFDNWEGVFECNVKGEYIEGYGDDARERQLVLEVSDNELQFKPFDKVLCRDCDSDEWQCDLYSHIQNDTQCPYVTVGHIWSQCIPYEGNEHLVGTTNNPKED